MAKHLMTTVKNELKNLVGEKSMNFCSSSNTHYAPNVRSVLIHWYGKAQWTDEDESAEISNKIRDLVIEWYNEHRKPAQSVRAWVSHWTAHIHIIEG